MSVMNDYDLQISELKEQNKILLEAIKSFKLWYMTLARMNPSSYGAFKEIMPNELINNFEQAIRKATEK